ncbi:MAG: recombinase family protein [Anaerorhabdus sp.]
METAIYNRISTKEQAENGYNLEGQRKSLVEYCERNLIDNYILFEDKGKSASNLNRNEMKKMISKIKKQEIDKVICYKLDRLTRKISDWLYLEKLFLKENIEFISLSESFDIKSSDGRFGLRMLILLADMEEDKISERTLEGLKNGIQNGRYTKSRVPFGYRKNKETGALIIIEEEKEIYMQIYDMILDGKNFSYIQQTLLLNEYLKKNNIPFSTDKIASVMKNKVYCGIVIQDKKEYVFKNMTPFLTLEEYNRLQFMVAVRSDRIMYDYLFYGNLQCECGDLMYVQSAYGRSRVYLYYHCKKCKNRVSEVNVLKDILVYLVLFFDKKIKDRNLKNYKAKLYIAHSKNRELEKVYKEEKISKKEYLTMAKEYEKEIKNIHKQFSEVHKKIEIEFNKMLHKDKRNLIDMYIEKIVVSSKMGLIQQVKLKRKKAK